MMIDTRGWPIRLVALTVLALVQIGCKAIPTEPSDPGTVVDRTYTNSEWGFSIAAPQDSAWSLAAIQIPGQREPNGLSPVQVILRRSNPGLPSRPALLLNASGSSQNEVLDDVVTTFESLFMAQFVNYNQLGPKSSRTVGGVPTVEWRFGAREPQSGAHFLNNRFLSVIFLRNNQIYVVVCSAQAEDFPEQDFRGILSTFEFLNR
jgi:hypothetical protein